ncbi:MAG: hypothetical protein DI598_05885 [Pseudopedobacter saltans]|uniref:Uncharacterized protein n=1 Tax=Pseudopedobacter saltans TaxID=151895 RepID=A0A2W5F682_9SPHI|nr:MAG: hypothetical protein DI598_05885 [Pseudopedobacter saltans]
MIYFARHITTPKPKTNNPMKRWILTLLFALGFTLSHSQQKNYKPLLDTFLLHAQDNFKEIATEANDTSVFSPSKLQADIGNVKIARYPNVTTLNWIIPLKQSVDIQDMVKTFIKEHFSDTIHFKIVTDGTKKEGYKTTNIYELKDDEKPLVIFRTILYKGEKNNGNFTITIYGK